MVLVSSSLLPLVDVRMQCEYMSCFLLGKVYLYIANLCMTTLILIIVLQIDVLFTNIRQAVGCGSLWEK